MISPRWSNHRAVDDWFTPRVCATGVWLVAVCFSIAWFSKYESTAGAIGPQNRAWPASTTLPRNLNGPTIVLFLHPKCPCSTASIRQLFEFTDGVKDAAIVTVLVLPTGTDESFAQGPVIDLLEREYQHRPIVDREGKEAELFGAQTSGQAYAYGLEARLLFCGGLTPARGQTGYTPSLHKLRTALQHRDSGPTSCPVFGCPLQNPPQRPET